MNKALCPMTVKTYCPRCEWNVDGRCAYEDILTPYDYLASLLTEPFSLEARWVRVQQEAYRRGWRDGQQELSQEAIEDIWDRENDIDWM